MTEQLLTIKLHLPILRKDIVPRTRLIERLNAGLWQEDGFVRKLTLVSAPAGYGKTTLVTEWLQSCRSNLPGCRWTKATTTRGVSWLICWLLCGRSMRRLDSAAEAMLQSPQPPPGEVILTALVNEIAAVPQPFILILDDYHVIHAPPIHQQLNFLLDHQPPQMHLVIITREDPPLPLARLRARGQMVEIRQEDLRFSLEECADFLNQVMGLNLPPADIAALERRTEGWIAGLQLAALSMRGSR